MGRGERVKMKEWIIGKKDGKGVDRRGGGVQQRKKVTKEKQDKRVTKEEQQISKERERERERN